MVKGGGENSANPSGLRLDISLGRVSQHWGSKLAGTHLTSVGESSRELFGVWGKPHTAGVRMVTLSDGRDKEHSGFCAMPAQLTTYRSDSNL